MFSGAKLQRWAFRKTNREIDYKPINIHTAWITNILTRLSDNSPYLYIITKNSLFTLAVKTIAHSGMSKVLNNIYTMIKSMTMQTWLHNSHSRALKLVTKLTRDPTKSCRSTRITRTASGAIEVLPKAAGAQGPLSTQMSYY